MGKLGRYSSHASLPGEYVTRTTSPIRKPAVIVKLNTGEKVQLLPAERGPPIRKQNSSNPWDTPCRSIRTIPYEQPALETQIPSIDSSPPDSQQSQSDREEIGHNLTRVLARSESPFRELTRESTSRISGSFDGSESIANLRFPSDHWRLGRSKTKEENGPESLYDVQKLRSDGIAQDTQIQQTGVADDLDKYGDFESELDRNDSFRSNQRLELGDSFEIPDSFEDRNSTKLDDEMIGKYGPQTEYNPQTDYNPRTDHNSQTGYALNTTTTVAKEGAFDQMSAENVTNCKSQDDVKQGPESDMGFKHMDAEMAKSSAESNGSQWLTSPHAMVSFSPEDIAEAQTRIQINFTLSEVIQSEYAYVKSLSLLGNFFIEPLLVKCTGLGITCTPLLSMDTVIKALRDKHEKFLSRVSSEKNIEQLAQEMTEVVAEPSYGSYAACAELLLFLVNKQVPPFESAYVSNLQTFLEHNQPGERRMDLSLSSLLQKPMGRVAKYRLFLDSLSTLLPQNSSVLDATERVNKKLTEINNEIKQNKERQAVLESVSQSLDLSESAVPEYQFYGLLNFFGSCTAIWLTYHRHGPLSFVRRDCFVFAHDNHLILADKKSQKVLFILSFPNSYFVSDPTNNDGGIFTDDRISVKVVFEKDNCQYELLLISDTEDSHEAFLRACQDVPQSTLCYESVSGNDCFVGPRMAEFDINVESPEMLSTRGPTCYFRQSYCYRQKPAESWLRAMSSMFRQSLGWWTQK